MATSTRARTQPRRTTYPDLSPARPATAPTTAPPAPTPDEPCPMPAPAPEPAATEWTDETTALIAGHFYAIEKLPFDPKTGVVDLYAITSEEGNVYHVSDHRDEPARCTCGDWIWRRDGRDPLGCKHVRGLVELDAIDNHVGRELETYRTAGTIAADEARSEVLDTFKRVLMRLRPPSGYPTRRVREAVRLSHRTALQGVAEFEAQATRVIPSNVRQ